MEPSNDPRWLRLAKIGHNMARKALDKYRTPPWMTEAFKESFPAIGGGLLIDPCCGDGRMVTALSDRFGDYGANDIDKSESFPSMYFDATGDDLWEGSDLARMILPCHRNTWVITNPPFAHAAEIAQQALSVTPNVALLLRMTWLEPRPNRMWLGTNPPDCMLVLPRGSFSGGGCDMTSCAWYVWGDAGPVKPIRVYTKIPGQELLKIGEG